MKRPQPKPYSALHEYLVSRDRDAEVRREIARIVEESRKRVAAFYAARSRGANSTEGGRPGRREGRR